VICHAGNHPEHFVLILALVEIASEPIDFIMVTPTWLDPRLKDSQAQFDKVIVVPASAIIPPANRFQELDQQSAGLLGAFLKCLVGIRHQLHDRSEGLHSAPGAAIDHLEPLRWAGLELQ